MDSEHFCSKEELEEIGLKYNIPVFDTQSIDVTAKPVDPPKPSKWYMIIDDGSNRAGPGPEVWNEPSNFQFIESTFGPWYPKREPDFLSITKSIVEG